MKPLLLVLGLLALSGCASVLEPPPPPPPPLPPPELEAPFTPAQKAACSQKGGRMARGGLSAAYLCVVPYKDAGKKCRDDADCQGKCLESGGAMNTLGGEAYGQCQANSAPWGCYAEIRQGRRQPMICVD